MGEVRDSKAPSTKNHFPYVVRKVHICGVSLLPLYGTSLYMGVRPYAPYLLHIWEPSRYGLSAACATMHGEGRNTGLYTEIEVFMGHVRPARQDARAEK